MYIGNTPAENYASFLTETFSVSATTNYTLSHAVTNENDIRLVINGVVQQPGSGKAYTASGTTLTLTSATVSGDVMYAVYLGRALQTVNPPNASVGIAQLADSAKNTPAFQAYRSSSQSTTSGSFTKLQLDTEDLDTGGYFDNSTNYRYTPLIAGKYFVYVSVRLHDDANDLLQYGAKINKNTSTVKENYNKGTANERGEITLATIIDMNGTDDYLEFYSWQVAGSGNPTIQGDSSNKSTSAGAYKLIGV